VLAGEVPSVLFGGFVITHRHLIILSLDSSDFIPQYSFYQNITNNQSYRRRISCNLNLVSSFFAPAFGSEGGVLVECPDEVRCLLFFTFMITRSLSSHMDS
jgi:hypothetical protein